MLIDANVPVTENVEDVLTPHEQALIMEGYMLDTLNDEELLEFISNPQEVTENINQEIITEKTVIRFDRAAKISRAQMIAVFSIAKERKDMLFRKLLTVWRMERFLEARLLKKYGSQAMRKARQAVTNAGRKPTPTVKKVINRAAVKAKRQFNALQDSRAKGMINKVSF